MSADPVEDQRAAAVAEVAAWADRLAKDPPPGTRMGPVTDMASNPVTHAIKTRMSTQPMSVCCEDAFRPAPTYYVPRHRIVLCVAHWNAVVMCTCCKECDACELPLTEDGFLTYMFFGATIVQAIICSACLDRL